MRKDGNNVQLTEYEQNAMDLPAEFPVYEALGHAIKVTRECLPYLRHAALVAQAKDTREVVQNYRTHFDASVAVGGLLRVVFVFDKSRSAADGLWGSPGMHYLG